MHWPSSTDGNAQFCSHG